MTVAPGSGDTGRGLGGPPTYRPRFARSALLTFGSGVTVALLQFGNVLLMGRVLGPQGRGEVALLITIALLSANLAVMGIEEANANFAGRDPRLRKALLVNSLVFAAVLGGIAVALVAALTEAFPAIGGGLSPGLRWAAIAAVPMLVLQIYLQFLLQADYRFALLNTASLFASFSSLAVNVLLAAVGALTVTAVLTVWLAGQAIVTATLMLYALRGAGGLGRPDAALARRALAFGIKSHPGRVMNFANFRLDQWILAGFAGSHALGLYSVSVAWAETMFFLPNALAIVQRPDLVRAGPADAARSAAAVFRACFVVVVPNIVLLVVLAPFLCETLFGADFAGSVEPLRILAIGGIGMAALKLTGDALVAQGRPGLTTAAVGAAFVVTVVGDVLLIPPLESSGAAIASAAAYSVGGAVAVAFFSRALGCSLADLVPRPSDASRLWRALRTTARRAPERPLA